MTTWQDRMTSRTPREPKLELVEMCWRMRSEQKATRILECGIYRTDAGLEVRVGYGPDDLLKSTLTRDVDVAREHAKDLLRIVRARGGFRGVAR